MHSATHKHRLKKKHETVMHIPVIIMAALQKCRDCTLSEAEGDAQTQPSQAALGHLKYE